MRPYTFGLLIAIPFAACTSAPMAPSKAPATITASSGVEGSATSNAVTTDRLRLRRAGGSDVVTSLENSQVIEVPINIRLDIWAEIRRLESDRARLVVDWGNGNSDFTGCGACRLENTYTREGRYTLNARVLDLNAVTGPPVVDITVTLSVFDPDRVPEPDAPSSPTPTPTPIPTPTPTPIPCVAVSGGDFAALPTDFLPVRIPGATLSAPGGQVTNSSYVPGGNFIQAGNPLTIAFDTDQSSMSIEWIHFSIPAIRFEAFDAAGNLVAAGSQPFTRYVVAGWTGGTAVISGVRFRRVILYDPHYYDNLTASCN